jgi:cellulase/cellobiase CelA1
MWAECLENVGATTSHNSTGLDGLLQGYLPYRNKTQERSHQKVVFSLTREYNCSSSSSSSSSSSGSSYNNFLSDLPLHPSAQKSCMLNHCVNCSFLQGWCITSITAPEASTVDTQ